MNRQDLEKQALDKVSSYNYYDLRDNLEITTDDELIQIINGNEPEVEE
jgi:hypothetical protein